MHCMDLKFTDTYPYKEQERRKQRDTQKKKWCENRLRDGMMDLQAKNAKDFQKPQEARREAWRDLPSEPTDETITGDTMILDLFRTPSE